MDPDVPQRSEEDQNSITSRFASFSIREYALKMRPSHGFGCEEPMQCRKFRWWASELEAERSSHGEKDGKKKSLKKKKRSILELFAVAPQVAPEVETEGDEDDGDAEKGKVLNKKDQRKAKKEKLNDVVPSKTRLSQLLRGSILQRRQEVNKDNKDKTRAAKVKGSSKQKKLKAIQSSTLLFKKKLRKPCTLPIHGILKNPKKVTSPNWSRNAGKSCKSTVTSHYLSKPAQRHVSFSDKNDIIRQKNKDSSTTMLPNASVMSAASDKATLPNFIATNESQCNSFPMRIVGANRPSCGVNQDNPMASTTPPETQIMHNCDTMGIHSVDLNHSPCGASHFTDQCGQVPFSSNVHTRVGSGSVAEYLLGGGMQIRPGSRMIFSNEAPEVVNYSWPEAPICSSSLEPCLQRTSLRNAMLNQSLHHQTNSFSINPQAEPSLQRLMSTVCSTMPGMQSCPSGIRINGAASTCHDMRNSRDLIGLPLNSQGEFIQWHSGDTQMAQNQSDFIGLKRNHMQNSTDHRNNVECFTKKGKCPETSINFNDKSSLFPDSPFIHINCLEQLDDHMGTTNHHISVSGRSQGCYDSSRTQNDIEDHDGIQLISRERHSQNAFQHENHPTVRLMGKDVTVGVNQSKFQEPLSGNGWLDKEIIVHRRPDSSTPNWLSHHSWIEGQTSGSAVNNIFDPINSRISPCVYQMMPVSPRQRYDQMDGWSQWTPGNSNSINRCPASALGHVLLKNTPPIEPSTLISPSVHCNAFPEMALSHAPDHHHPTPFHNERPYGPNFMNLDGFYQDRHAYTDRISQILPPWLANAKSQMMFLDALPSHDSSFSNYPFRISRAGPYHFNNPFPPMEFPCANSSTGYTFSPSIVARDALLVNPHFTMLQPNSDQHGIWKGDFVTNVGLSCFRRHGQTTETKRMLPFKDDELSRPGKKPHSIIASGPTFNDGSYVWGSTHCPSTLLDFNICQDKVSNAHDTSRDGHPHISTSNSQKLDGASKFMPVKLSAGARHILRPGRNMDSDGSIPVHSTIPFSVGPSSGKVHETRSKSEKIYQF